MEETIAPRASPLTHSFLVLCPGIEDLDAVADRLTAAIAQPAVIDLAPRISVGAALARRGEDPAALLRRADAAMYRVKTASPQVAHA